MEAPVGWSWQQSARAKGHQRGLWEQWHLPQPWPPTSSVDTGEQGALLLFKGPPHLWLSWKLCSSYPEFTCSLKLSKLIQAA